MSDLYSRGSPRRPTGRVLPGQGGEAVGAVVAVDADGTRVHRAVCPHDCWDTCALWVYEKEGRLIRVAGDPTHPVTRGFLCIKGHRLHGRTHSPDRVPYPLRRVGRKGEGRFERITWDEALARIADALTGRIARHGAETVLPYSYCGTMGLLQSGSMDRRFFNRLGATRLLRTICSAAASTALGLTLGRRIGPDPEIMTRARLIIVWGLNAVGSNPHQGPLLKEAKKSGAYVVVIDPYKNGTARLADLHLRPRAGTDAALALGLMHVIVREGLHDRAFIASHTAGFAALEQRLAEWPPARAAAVTGVAVAEIEELARRFATTRPALIRAGLGMQRHTNAGATTRALALLSVLTGAWRDPAGGLLQSNGGSFRLHTEVLERRDLLPDPAPREVNMVRLGEALLELNDPPVTALIVYNSNPAAVAPNQNRVIDGLMREDLFTVVHEQMMTDTTRYADIVLPATTCFEHLDLYKSYWHRYLMLSQPVLAPQGEALPNTEFFRRLARAMGLDDPCFAETDEQMLRSLLAAGDDPALAGITYERLLAEGWIKAKIDPDEPPFATGFATPSGKVEFYSQELEKMGLDPVVDYHPLAESREASPKLYARYPLHLLTPGAHHFLNSTWANLYSLRRREGGPVVHLHPSDARARGIQSGDWVRLYNDRGEVRIPAAVDDVAPPGHAISTGLWWNRHMPGGQGINVLTTDALSDLGGGAAFHTNLVQIEKAEKVEGMAVWLEAEGTAGAEAEGQAAAD